MPRPLRAALYARVSEEDQRERYTIETQLECFDRYCAQHDLQPAGRYLDEEVYSGLMMGDRPAGARLLADARAGAFDLVLLYRWDRLGRKPWVVWDAIFQIEEQAGRRLKSMTQQADTSTPENVLLLCLDTGVSNLERETMIRRTTDALDMLARKGAWIGGPAPYGYRKIGQRRESRIQPSEEPIPGLALSEADVVRMIYRLCIDERLGCHRIAERVFG